MTVRGYRLGIDWSRAGTYAGPYEDASVRTDSDIVITVGRDSTRAAADLPAGTLDFTVDDSARALAPDRTASPLYGKVGPGVPARLDLTVSGATAPLFVGSIDKLTYNPNDDWSLSGTLMDAWGLVASQTISTPVYQGYRTGDLIGVILDKIGWPAADRSIDPGATVVPYWWVEGKGVADAIQELADSEGPPAIAYVDAGVFVFEDRHHRMFATRSTTTQATYTHIYPEGTGPGSDFKMLRGSISYDHGRSNIVNSASFQVDVRAPAPTVVVWSTDSLFVVPAGTTTTIFASSSDPFVGALVEATDYTLLGGSITVGLDRTSGQSLTLSITAGGTDATVATLQVRAAPITVARTVKVEAEDAGSVGTKGRKSWDRTLPWAGPYDAQAIANRIVSTYATARPVLTFAIDGAISTTYLAEFAARKVSDRITVREDIVGLNTAFIVERVRREITALGVNSRLVITCELPQPTQAANALTFDVAGRGFNDGAFAADGVDNATTAFRFDVAGRGFNDGAFAN